MLYVKLKKIIIFALVAFLASSILFATNSYAALFEVAEKAADGNRHDTETGNFNWKWLGAIIIGLMVIALTAGIINYMVEETVITPAMITDTLISGNDSGLAK